MEQLIGARLGWLEHDPHKLMGLTTKKSFAPIAKMNTIRVLFSLVVTQDWPLHQLDIKKYFFFHEDLEEEVYMELPPSFKEKFESSLQIKKVSL